MPEDTTEQPAQNAAVTTELAVVTTAIEVSLNVREITPEYAKRRDDLLTTAEEFTAPPDDDDSQEQIQVSRRSLGSLRNEIVKQGEAYKAPLNAARKKIIDIVNTEVAKLEREELRLQGLVNNRQMKLIEAQKKLDATAATAAADTQRKLKEAEEAAARAEEAAKVAAAAPAPIQAYAETKAEEAARLAQEAADDAFLATLNAEIPKPVSNLPIAREVRDFEIIGDTDTQKKASLIKLLCAHPEFFNATVKSETPRGFSLHLRVSDLTDSLAGKPPFKKIDGAPGIRVITRLSNLR